MAASADSSRRPFEVFYGQDARVVLNPTTGRIVSVNPVREGLRELSARDPELLFAYRRKIFKELSYDERSKPMDRRKLKAQNRREQEGKCPLCQNPLPETYCVLDRLVASAGYTAGNTRLICICHKKSRRN